MELNILGARVVVIENEHLDARGEAVFDKKEIHIRKDLTGMEREQVLNHEIMHWILYRCGLNEGLDSAIVEAICDVVGFVYSENGITLCNHILISDETE